MAGVMSGGRLAAAVAAAAAAAPGGSNNHGRASDDRKAAMSATLFPAGRFTRCSLAAAAGALPRHGKSRQLAVVVAAATAAPGESDEGLPSVDCEAAVSIFRLEMASFKLTQRSLALVGSPTDLLLDTASGTAEQCTQMLEFLLAKKPVRRDILEEMIQAGKSFLIVESQAKQGYVKADSLVNVIEGVKLVGTTFFEDANLPEYSAPVVPLAADDVDKDSFFKELVDLLIVFYTAVYWKARDKYKYGFGKAGVN